MKVFIEPIARLINEFTKLPGVGAKTAQRYAYKVINMSEDEARAFAFAERVLPQMDALRSHVDEMETLTDRRAWPMPTYGDLTYRV